MNFPLLAVNEHNQPKGNMRKIRRAMWRKHLERNDRWKFILRVSYRAWCETNHGAK